MRLLIRRSPAARVVLAVTALAVIAFFAWRIGQHFWANGQLRAARAALDLSQVARARTHLLAYLSVRPDDPEVHLLLARAARRSGDMREANDRLKRAKQLGALPEQIQLERLLQDVQRGLMGTAESQLLAYTDKGHPNTIDILEALAQGYLVTFRLTQARATLDRLLALQPANAPAWLMRGQASYHMRGYTEAAHDYGRAVELAPDDVEARITLAICLLENAQPEQALAHFDVLLKTNAHPGDGQDTPRNELAIAIGRATCLLELGRTDEAEAVLSPLLKTAPDDFQVLTLRGKLALRQGDPATAEAWLKKAVDRQPGDRDAVYSYSLSLQRQQDKAKQVEASRWFKQVKFIEAEQHRLADATALIMSNPHDPAPRQQAGEIFLKLGNEKEGLRWLNSALELDPRHQPTHRLLRDHFRAKGQPERAAIHEQALTKE